METSQAIALERRLLPSEQAVWAKICREFSKRFHTPLLEVHGMNPEFILTELYSDNLDEWDLEERLPDLEDIVGSLSDPDYDAAKERAFREETRKMVEEERERLKNNRPIHSSLEKDKHVFQKEQPQAEPPKDFPKSGGLNMNLLKQLANDETESGEF